MLKRLFMANGNSQFALDQLQAIDQDLDVQGFALHSEEHSEAHSEAHAQKAAVQLRVQTNELRLLVLTNSNASAQSIADCAKVLDELRARAT